MHACMQRGTNLEFYDTWVARDIDGNLLSKQAPYLTDPYSLERAAQGLPFPAKCCWNGVIAMKAAPFSHHSLRIRWAACMTACFAQRQPWSIDAALVWPDSGCSCAGVTAVGHV